MQVQATVRNFVLSAVVILDTAIGWSQEVGKVRRVTSGRIAFCWCPPGEFQAGSAETELGRDGDEAQGKVIISNGFWIGRTEITEAQWSAVGISDLEASIAAMAASLSGDHLPKTGVSWTEATDYCDRLTKYSRQESVMLGQPKSAILSRQVGFSEALSLKAGESFRLPTEAEWEYACRAGTTTAFSSGDELESIVAASWFRDVTPGAELSQAQFVGKKIANPFGLFDVHGNVWEWCSDSYEIQRTFGADLNVQTVSSLRVHRGGSWRYPANRARSANRDGRAAEYKSDDIGLRIVIAPVKTE